MRKAARCLALFDGDTDYGGRTSTYTIGSSLGDEVVEENGRTYHVYKDGSGFAWI
jgi:hypothetical protein